MDGWIHRSMDPSIHTSMAPSIHPSIHPSISFYHGPSSYVVSTLSSPSLSISRASRSVCPSIHLCTRPSVCLSVHPPIRPSVCPSMHPPIHPSCLSPPLHLVTRSAHLPIFVFLCVLLLVTRIQSLTTFPFSNEFVQISQIGYTIPQLDVKKSMTIHISFL